LGCLVAFKTLVKLLNLYFLQISPEGVVARDEKVFRFAKDQNIPLLMLTSGEILLPHFVVCPTSCKSANAIFLCTITILRCYQEAT